MSNRRKARLMMAMAAAALSLAGAIGFWILPPPQTKSDLVYQQRLLRFGRPGEIEIFTPVDVLEADVELVIPHGYRFRTGSGPHSAMRRSLAAWLRSGTDGAGFYKTSLGHSEFFVPAYIAPGGRQGAGTPGATGRRLGGREQGANARLHSQGLVALSALIQSNGRLRAKKGTPLFQVPSGQEQTLTLEHLCPSPEPQLLPPVDPELAGVAVTSPFGFRARDKRMHEGLDIKAPAATPIRASADGRVAVIGFGPRGFGHYIVLAHDDGVKTLYAHIAKRGIRVRPGQYVQKGDIIARVGNSGRVRGHNGGYHLHYEVQRDGFPVNPERGFLAAAYARAPSLARREPQHTRQAASWRHAVQAKVCADLSRLRQFREPSVPTAERPKTKTAPPSKRAPQKVPLNKFKRTV